MLLLEHSHFKLWSIDVGKWFIWQELKLHCPILMCSAVFNHGNLIFHLETWKFGSIFSSLSPSKYFEFIASYVIMKWLPVSLSLTLEYEKLEDSVLHFKFNRRRYKMTLSLVKTAISIVQDGFHCCKINENFQKENFANKSYFVQLLANKS